MCDKKVRSRPGFGEIVPIQEAGSCYCQPCTAPSASAPPPVLAVKQRCVNSRSISELFSLCYSQTFLDAMLVFWGMIFNSPACFLRSVAFSTIFFCRFKMRSSFISLSPDWDFLFFSSCLQNQKEARRR